MYIVYNYVWFFLYIGIIIACLIVNYLNRQFLPHYFRYFQLLFIIVIIFETLGEIYKDFSIIILVIRSGKILKYFKVNTSFLDHFYQPVELTLLSIVYKSAIKSYTFQKIVIYIILVFWFVALGYSFFVEGIFNENKFSFFLGSFIVIIYSYRYIFELYTSPPAMVNLLTIPFFWIVTANLFYYYGIYFYMGLESFITNEAMRDKLKVINMALNYALYILYLIGFSCRKIFKYTY